MGLLSQIGKLTRNQARVLRETQMHGSQWGRNAEFGLVPEFARPQLLRNAGAVTNGALPNIGRTGMDETEMEVVRLLQSGQSKEQIADQLYQGGVPPQFVEAILTKAQRKLMSAGELF